MSVALRLYEQLTEAGEDRTRAKAIADAFEQLEERYPHLKEVATQSQVRETELRLQKEIKEVESRLQVEIREVESRLQLEIREVENRLQVEIREVESRLQVEIREVEKRLQVEIKEVEKRLQVEIREVDMRIKDVEIRLTQAIHRQTLWVIGSVGAVVGGIRLLEWFLAHLPAT